MDYTKEFENVYERINKNALGVEKVNEKVDKVNEKVNDVRLDQANHEKDNAKTEVYVKEMYKDMKDVKASVGKIVTDSTTAKLEKEKAEAEQNNDINNNKKFLDGTKKIAYDFIKMGVPFLIGFLLSK